MARAWGKGYGCQALPVRLSHQGSGRINLSLWHSSTCLACLFVSRWRSCVFSGQCVSVCVGVHVCLAGTVSGVSGHRDRVCMCLSTGFVPVQDNSRMYFRLACVSVKLKARLPTFLGPAGRCLRLMTRECWSSSCARPSPFDCQVSRGTPSVPVRLSSCSACAILSVSDSDSPKCLRGTSVWQWHGPMFLRPASVWQRHRLKRLRILRVSHSDTAPAPKTSAWLCLVVSLSRTPQHRSCVSQWQSRTSGQHVSVRPCDTAPRPSDRRDSHAPRTRVLCLFVTQPRASDPRQSETAAGRGPLHECASQRHSPAWLSPTCLSVCPCHRPGCLRQARDTGPRPSELPLSHACLRAALASQRHSPPFPQRSVCACEGTACVRVWRPCVCVCVCGDRACVCEAACVWEAVRVETVRVETVRVWVRPRGQGRRGGRGRRGSRTRTSARRAGRAAAAPLKAGGGGAARAARRGLGSAPAGERGRARRRLQPPSQPCRAPGRPTTAAATPAAGSSGRAASRAVTKWRWCWGRSGGTKARARWSTCWPPSRTLCAGARWVPGRAGSAPPLPLGASPPRVSCSPRPPLYPRSLQPGALLPSRVPSPSRAALPLLPRRLPALTSCRSSLPLVFFLPSPLRIPPPRPRSRGERWDANAPRWAPRTPPTLPACASKCHSERKSPEL